MIGCATLARRNMALVTVPTVNRKLGTMVRDLVQTSILK
jgi:hypothetical protein